MPLIVVDIGESECCQLLEPALLWGEQPSSASVHMWSLTAHCPPSQVSTASLFDAVLATGVNPKTASNWIVGDVMAYCKVGGGLVVVADLGHWLRHMLCGRAPS